MEPELLFAMTITPSVSSSPPVSPANPVPDTASANNKKIQVFLPVNFIDYSPLLVVVQCTAKAGKVFRKNITILSRLVHNLITPLLKCSMFKLARGIVGADEMVSQGMLTSFESAMTNIK
jgi:hypothetical protein